MSGVIASSRVRGLAGNLFFGGVGGVITNENILANSLLSITANNIKNFTINDTLDIKCSIDELWGFNAGDFPDKANLKSIIDLQGNARQGIGNDNLRNANNLQFLYLPRIGENGLIQTDAFQCSSNGIIYIPNATFGFNFEDTYVRFGYVFLNSIWEGSTDPTIQKLESNTNGTVVYIQNDNAPSEINQVTINDEGVTFVDFSLTFPSHTNVMQFVEIWVNGFFQEIIETTNDILLSNLNPNENNVIDIYVADEYYNRSPKFSFIVNNNFIISQNTIGGTYVLLDENYIAPNETKTVEVYVNGVLNNTITNAGKGGVYAVNLDELTNYDIYLVIEGNQSNTINVTTTAIPVLFQNAVAYYKLDEISGDAIDVVSGYNGTLFGGVTQGVAGKIGNAYSFNGIDGYIKTTLDPISLGWNNISFSTWFKTDDTSSGAHLIFSISSTDTNLGTRLRVSVENGQIWIRVQGAISYTGIFNDNNWHHIAVNIDLMGTTTDIQVYVDNVQLSISTDTQTQLNVVSDVVYIGSQSGTFSYYKGELDEYDIREIPYTVTQISDLYNNGLGTTI